MVTRDEMKLIKGSKKYLSWLFEDDSLLIDSPILVILPEGELKLTNTLNTRRTKWSFRTWMNLALMGRPGNRESRKRASEIIIQNPNLVTDDIAQLDVDRALSLLENSREKSKTREAMLMLLCLKGEGDYVDKVIYEFRRKEIYGKEWNRLNDSTVNIFSTYLFDNDIPIGNYFEFPSDLSSERICSLIAVDEDIKKKIIDSFKLNFQSDDDDKIVHSYGGNKPEFLLEWSFIYRTIGEEHAFDMLWKLFEQPVTDKTIYRWFKINQLQYKPQPYHSFFPLIWKTDYVKLRLIELSTIDRINPRILDGIIYGLGSFNSKDAMNAIFDSMLKQEPRKATSHYYVLGNNIQYSHVNISRIMEETKEGGDLFKSPIIEHLAHVISESGSWNNNISSTNYGEDVRGLFRELATYTSEEGFDSMLQASQYIFSSDEANEIIKIVATKRHPGQYSEEFNDSEKSKFIDEHLHQYFQLVSALEEMASKGSTQAKEIINNDNLIEKINKIIENGDADKLRLILNNTTQKSRRGSIDPHLLTMYEKSNKNKNLILRTSQRKAWKGGVEIEGLDELIIRDLKNYSSNKEEHNENLIYAAQDYSKNQEMIDIILHIFQKRIDSSGSDLELKILSRTLATIGTDETKKTLDRKILDVSDSLASNIAWELCNQNFGYWSENVEEVLLNELTEASELSLIPIIRKIQWGKPSEKTLQEVARIMEFHQHMAVKCCAIECLSYRQYKPAIPFMISLLKYGRQKKEVLKPLDGGVISGSYSGQEDLLQHLGRAFLRFRNDVIKPLIKELDSLNDNTRFGAALILNTIGSRYEEENLDLPETKIDDIIQEIPDSFNEDYKEPEPVFMKMKPCCKHCKKPLCQDDQDYEVYEEELDENGEIEVQKVGDKTIEEAIVDMELCCNTCMTEIINESYEKGLCYICYDEGLETTGSIANEENNMLFCKDCESYRREK